MDTLPAVARLKKEFESKGLVLLPVYVHPGSLDDIKQFAASMKVDFPLYMVSKETSLQYENSMVPALFLIDRKGQIERRFMGFKKYPVLSEAITVFHGNNQEAKDQIITKRNR